MRNEIWKDVVGYEVYYQVSSIGNIRHKERVVQYGKSKPYTRPAKEGTPLVNHYGYPAITLCKNSKPRKWPVHILVAAAFLGERPKNYHINHINGIKTDNRVENLEYCTAKENISHAWRNGMHENNRSYNKKAKNQAIWLVLQTETGIFYESIKKAAIAHNWKERHVRYSIDHSKEWYPVQLLDRYVKANL